MEEAMEKALAAYKFELELAYPRPFAWSFREDAFRIGYRAALADVAKEQSTTKVPSLPRCIDCGQMAIFGTRSGNKATDAILWLCKKHASKYIEAAAKET